MDKEPSLSSVLVVQVQEADKGARLQKLRTWKEQQKVLWEEVWKETERGKNRFPIRDLLADNRCSRVVLDFLSTTDVGRLAPAPVEEDAQSEALEWELRERREREEEKGAEAERLGAEVEEPLFLPTPAFMAFAEEE